MVTFDSDFYDISSINGVRQNNMDTKRKLNN